MMLGMLIVGSLVGLVAGAVAVFWFGLPVWLGLVIWSGLGGLVTCIPLVALALRVSFATPRPDEATGRDFVR